MNILDIIIEQAYNLNRETKNRSFIVLVNNEDLLKEIQETIEGKYDNPIILELKEKTFENPTLETNGFEFEFIINKEIAHLQLKNKL